jgi:hypothetical protein
LLGQSFNELVGHTSRGQEQLITSRDDGPNGNDCGRAKTAEA